MPSEVEVVAAGRGSVSVLLHLWAKFRNQTRSIVADKGLGNWDDERVCHVKFRWSRTSGTRSIHGISSVSSATRFFLDRQLHLGVAVELHIPVVSNSEWLRKTQLKLLILDQPQM